MTLRRWGSERRGPASPPRPVVETTVTFLAMDKAPASLPAMPGRPRLALMQAETIPLHFYRYLYATVGRPWLWVERRFLDDEALASRVHRDGVEIFVAYANGSPAGFFEMDFGTPQKADIAYFGLVPNWIGHRIGPWLLGAAVSRAFSKGVSRLTVNTCTMDHPAALPLYQKVGFAPVNQQRRRFSVPDGVEIPEHVQRVPPP